MSEEPVTKTFTVACHRTLTRATMATCAACEYKGEVTKAKVVCRYKYGCRPEGVL